MIKIGFNNNCVRLAKRAALDDDLLDLVVVEEDEVFICSLSRQYQFTQATEEN